MKVAPISTFNFTNFYLKNQQFISLKVNKITKNEKNTQWLDVSTLAKSKSNYKFDVRFSRFEISE
jgi:hypothetical protein